MHVEVILALFAPDPKHTGQPLVLLGIEAEECVLPNLLVKDSESVYEAAKRLLDRIIGGSQWIRLAQGDVADGANRIRPVQDRYERALAVPFGAMIPEAVQPLKWADFSWTSVRDAVEKGFVGDHKEILVNLAKRV